MNTFLNNSLLSVSKLCGIECCTLSDQQRIFHFVVLERKKGEVDIIEQGKHIASVEELMEQVPKGVPIAINVTGKGVLHKAIPLTKANWEEALQGVLPNVVTADFTGQMIPSSEGGLISIIRKEKLDECLDFFKAYPVVGMAIGASPLSVSMPLIAVEHFTTSSYEVSVTDGKIKSIKSSELTDEEKLNIGSAPLSNLLLPSFSTALAHFLYPENQPYAYEKIQAYKSAFKYEQTAKLIGWGGLVFLLFVLLINFLSFSWLSNQNNSLAQVSSYNQQQATALQMLEKQLQEKRAVLENNSMLTSSKTSFYADEIARLIPTGIQLNQLNIFPTIKTDNKAQSPQYDKNQIRLKGTCKNSALLNLYIRQLESLDWVKKVKVLPYREDERGLGIFELAIMI